MSSASSDQDPRIEAVRTGSPITYLLACVECGVLLWDPDAHYEHAHPGKPAPSAPAVSQVSDEHGDARMDRQLAAEVAAKTGPAAPPTDREKLIADAKAAIRRCSFASGVDHATIFDAIDALAASLNPEKVADVLEREIDKLRHETRLYPDVYKKPIADALCEAYTEGKLT